MDICFGDYSLKSGWLLQIIYPTDASKEGSCSSWFLYFLSKVLDCFFKKVILAQI